MEMKATPTVDERLERLERENLWLKRLGLALAIGTAAVVVLGTDLVRPRRRVTAERFEVRDRSGVVRASLALKDDGMPGLAMYDERGREQVSAHTMLDGTSAFSLSERGKLRVSLAAAPNGTAVVNIHDRGGHVATGMYSWPDGVTGFAARDGLSGVSLNVEPDGRAKLGFTDVEGNEVGGVAMTSTGQPRYLVSGEGAAGSLRIIAPTTSGNRPLEVQDPPSPIAETKIEPAAMTSS